MTAPITHQRALIFTGGNTGAWSLTLIEAGDYLIGADRGADFLIRNGYTPHLSLGDFDSVSVEERERIRSVSGTFSCYDAVDKDWTDTELALREALNLGFRDLIIVGGLGTRFDHSLANVHLLVLAEAAGAAAKLVDEHNEIRLLTGSCRLEADERYTYVSLLPLTPEVRGVTLHGFAYPLNEATLVLGQSLGISNRLIDSTGHISITEGSLLVIRSRD